MNELLSETGLSSDDVDDLQWDCAKQVKEQGNNLARVIALLSDLGEEVPGIAIDRLCGSSAQAIAAASNLIRLDFRNCIIAGGVENMPRVERERGLDSYPGIREQYDVDALQMGMTAEAVAEQFDISREAQDAYGARSQQHAVAATEAGRFDDEIAPIDTGKDIINRDEGLRPGTTSEALADLPTVFKEDGTVTPGNASQISIGAAAVVLTSREFAENRGLEIMAEVGAHNVAAVDPEIMGIGPVPAVWGLLDLAGTMIDEYDLIELNEAFASQTL